MAIVTAAQAQFLGDVIYDAAFPSALGSSFLVWLEKMETLGLADFVASALNGGAALTCMELDGSVGSMMLRGKTFSDLDILDLKEVQLSTNPHVVLKWNLWVFFKRAKTVLELCFLDNKSSEPLKEDEREAVVLLQSFFNENLMEQFQELLPLLKGKRELDVDFSIAHNILGPLADGCMLNERHQSLGLCCAKTCKFCAKLNVPSTCNDSKFSGLAMGHTDAWYGEPDMMVLTAAFCCDSHVDDGSDSPGEGTGIERKVNLEDKRIGQTVATAITYSYIQNQRHPQNNKLIPTLNVSSDGFYAIFYDSEKDYLLRTEAFQWNAASIVILWAILNHRLFCRHEGITNIVECGYLKMAREQKCGLPFVKELVYRKSLGAFRNDQRQSKRARVELRTIPIIPAKQWKL